MEISKAKWVIGTSLLLGAVTATAINANAEDVMNSLNINTQGSIKTLDTSEIEGEMTIPTSEKEKVLSKYSDANAEDSSSQDKDSLKKSNNQNSDNQSSTVEENNSTDLEVKDLKHLKQKGSDVKSDSIDKLTTENSGAQETADTPKVRARRDATEPEKMGATLGFKFSNEKLESDLGFDREHPYEIDAKENKIQKMTLNLGVNSSGVDKEYGSGKINIYIPKGIFKDWNGGDKVNYDFTNRKMEYVSQYSSTLKPGEEKSDKAFKYVEEGDKIHIFNYKSFRNQVFNLGINYSFLPSLTESSEEGKIFEDSIIYDVDGKRIELPFYIKLKTNHNKLKATSNVHKYSNPTDVEIYQKWQDTWGENPDKETDPNSDKYYYIVWNLDVTRPNKGNEQDTRPFTYNIVDDSEVTPDSEGDGFTGGKILGIKKVISGDDSTYKERDFPFGYRYFNENNFNSNNIVSKSLTDVSNLNPGSVIVGKTDGLGDKARELSELEKAMAGKDYNIDGFSGYERVRLGISYNDTDAVMRYLILKKYDRKKIDAYIKQHEKGAYLLKSDFKVNVTVKNGPSYTVDAKNSVAFKHKSLGPSSVKKLDPERAHDADATDEFRMRGAIDVFKGKLRPERKVKDGKYYIVQKDGAEREITKDEYDSYENELKLTSGAYGFTTEATLLNEEMKEKEVEITEGKYYYQMINNSTVQEKDKNPQLDISSIDALDSGSFIKGSDVDSKVLETGESSPIISIQSSTGLKKFEPLSPAVELKDGDVVYRSLYIEYDERDGIKYENGAVELVNKINDSIPTVNDVEAANGDYLKLEYKPFEIYIKLKGSNEYEEFGKVFRTNAGYKFYGVEKYKEYTKTDLALDKIDYINDRDKKQIFLPKNVVGIKYKHKSSHMRTDIKIYSTPVLKKTERVDEMARQASDTKSPYIYTNATMTYDGSTFHTDDVVSRAAYTLQSVSRGTAYGVGVNDIYNNNESSNKNIVIDNDKNKEYAEVYTYARNVFSMSPYQPAQGDAGLDFQEIIRAQNHINNGTFYVLLPEGTSIKPGSVRMFDNRYMDFNIYKDIEKDPSGNSKTRDAVRNENEMGKDKYTVQYTGNWKDTGRTLMTVNFENILKYDKYGRERRWNDWNNHSGIYLRYILEKPFSMINMYGVNSSIHSIFTTDGGEYYFEGKKDLFNSNDKVLLGFDEIIKEKRISNENTKYQYASTNIIYVDPKISQTGLSETTNSTKMGVLNVEDKEKEVPITEPGEQYSYNVEFTPDVSAQSSDIVFFTEIEKNRKSYKDESKAVDTQWNGGFQGIDVGSIATVRNSSKGNEKIFADPKVYYGYLGSIADEQQDETVKKNIDSAKGLFSEKGASSYQWSDKLIEGKDVKAVIVDVRKDKKGNSFVFASSNGSIDKTLAFNINMVAPNKYPENMKMNGKISGNEVFLSRKQSAMGSTEGKVESNGSLTNIVYVSSGNHILKYNVVGDDIYGKPEEKKVDSENVVNKNLTTPDGIGTIEKSGEVKDGFSDNVNLNVSGDLSYNEGNLSAVKIKDLKDVKESTEENAKDVIVKGKWVFSGWSYDNKGKNQLGKSDNGYKYITWNSYNDSVRSINNNTGNEEDKIAIEKDTINLYGKWKFVPEYQLSYEIKGDSSYNMPNINKSWTLNEGDKLYGEGVSIKEGLDKTSLEEIKKTIDKIGTATTTDGEKVNGKWYITGWYLGEDTVSNEAITEAKTSDAFEALSAKIAEPEKMLGVDNLKITETGGKNYYRLPVYAHLKFIPDQYRVVYDVKATGDYKPIYADGIVVDDGDEEKDIKNAKIVASGKVDGDSKIPEDSNAYKNTDVITLKDPLSPNEEEVQGKSGDVYYHGDWKFEGWFYDSAYNHNVEGKLTWDSYKNYAEKNGIALPDEGQEGHNTIKLYGKWSFTPKYQVSYSVKEDPMYKTPTLDTGYLTSKIKDDVYSNGEALKEKTATDSDGAAKYLKEITSLREKLASIKTADFKDGAKTGVKGHWEITGWYIDNNKISDEDLKGIESVDALNKLLEKADKPTAFDQSKVTEESVEGKTYKRLHVYAQTKFIPDKFKLVYDVRVPGEYRPVDLQTQKTVENPQESYLQEDSIIASGTASGDNGIPNNDNLYKSYEAMAISGPIVNNGNVEGRKGDVYYHGDWKFAGWYYDKDYSKKVEDGDFTWDSYTGNVDELKKAGKTVEVKDNTAKLYGKWEFTPKYKLSYNINEDASYKTPESLDVWSESGSDALYSVDESIRESDLDSSYMNKVKDAISKFNTAKKGKETINGKWYITGWYLGKDTKNSEINNAETEQSFNTISGEIGKPNTFLGGDNLIKEDVNGKNYYRLPVYAHLKFIPEQYKIVYDVKIDGNYKPVSEDGKTVGDSSNELNIVASGAAGGSNKVPENKKTYKNNEEIILEAGLNPYNKKIQGKSGDVYYHGDWKFEGWYYDQAYKKKVEGNPTWDSYNEIAKTDNITLPNEGQEGHNTIKLYGKWSFTPKYQLSYKINSDPSYKDPSIEGIDLAEKLSDPTYEEKGELKDLSEDRSTNHLGEIASIREKISKITSAVDSSGNKINGHWIITDWKVGKSSVTADSINNAKSEEDFNNLYNELPAPSTMSGEYSIVETGGKNYNRLPVYAQLKFIPEQYKIVYDVKINGNYKPVSKDVKTIGDSSNELNIVASGAADGSNKVPTNKDTYKNNEAIAIAESLKPYTEDHNNEEVQGNNNKVYYHGDWKFAGWYYDQNYNDKVGENLTWNEYEEYAKKHNIELADKGKDGHNTIKLYGKWEFTPKYQLSYKIKSDPLYKTPTDITNLEILTPKISDKSYKADYEFNAEKVNNDYRTISEIKTKLKEINKGTKNDGTVINGRWIISSWYTGSEVSDEKINGIKDNDEIKSLIDGEFKRLFDEKLELKTMNTDLLKTVNTDEKDYKRLPVYAQLKFIPKKYKIKYNLTLTTDETPTTGGSSTTGETPTGGSSQGTSTPSTKPEKTIEVKEYKINLSDIEKEIKKAEDKKVYNSKEDATVAKAPIDKPISLEGEKDGIFTKGDLSFEGWYYLDKNGIEQPLGSGNKENLGNHDKKGIEIDLENVQVHAKWDFVPKYEAVYKVSVVEESKDTPKLKLPDKILKLVNPSTGDNSEANFETIKSQSNDSQQIFVRTDNAISNAENSDKKDFYKDSKDKVAATTYNSGNFVEKFEKLFNKDGVYVYNNEGNSIFKDSDTTKTEIDNNKLGYVDVKENGVTVRKYGIWKLVDREWSVKKNNEAAANSEVSNNENETRAESAENQPKIRSRRSLSALYEEGSAPFMMLLTSQEETHAEEQGDPFNESYLSPIENGGKTYKYVLFEKQLRFIPYYQLTYVVNNDPEYSIPTSSGGSVNGVAKDLNDTIAKIQENSSQDTKFEVGQNLKLKDSTSVEKIKELLKNVTTAQRKDGSTVSGKWYITGWYLGDKKIGEEELKKVGSEEELNKLITKLSGEETMANPEQEKEEFVSVDVDGKKEVRLPLSVQLKFVPNRYTSGHHSGGINPFVANAEEKPEKQPEKQDEKATQTKKDEKPENTSVNVEKQNKEEQKKEELKDGVKNSNKATTVKKTEFSSDSYDPNKLAKTGTKDSSILTAVSGMFISLAGVILMRKKKEDK